MTSTATLARIDTLTEVAHLDNGGEACLHCQVEGQVVEVQIYFDEDGERVMEDGCTSCMFDLILSGLDNLTMEVQK